MERIKMTIALHLRLVEDKALHLGEYDLGYLEKLLDEQA